MATSADILAELTPHPARLLRKDLAKSAQSLGHAEIRYLVDHYYTLQEYRTAAGRQVRSLAADNEPHTLIAWAQDTMHTLETDLKRALDVWTDGQELGRWCKSIVGIGPVISAGLMAHIDITKAPTVGHIWRYAGLDPTQTWAKGERRPWNARLKVLAWKIGESFVKTSNHKDSYYGAFYRGRKDLEIAHNERGDYADQAAARLERKLGKNTEAYQAYSAGKLPPAHIHARARRWTVKLFLAHYHATAYRLHYGTNPPLPYALGVLGHADQIMPPPTGTKYDEE